MNHPQQQESREHCPNCPDCGRGGCSIRHQKVGSRGGNKAIKHEYYHCQNKPQQQESWVDRFENEFDYLYEKDEVKAFISTERQRVIEEVRELVEGMKKVGTEIQERQWCKCGNLPQSKYCDDCRRKVVFKTAHRFTNDEYTHNQALDDLLLALKEMEEK